MRGKHSEDAVVAARSGFVCFLFELAVRVLHSAKCTLGAVRFAHLSCCGS